MTLLDWIEDLAQDILLRIQEDGCAPPGHNGPYRDPETSVRNTGHWLIAFSRLLNATGNKAYLEGACKCAKYLIASEARPAGYTFHHRNKPGKDRCNGLIGQAWTIESLAEAGRLTDDPCFLSVAEDVFLLHDFHDGVGLWYRREIDGRQLTVDRTFNHQLWFAAAAALLGTDIAYHRVSTFLDCLTGNVVLYPSGLVWHPIATKVARVFDVEKCNPIKSTLKQLRWQVSDTLRPTSHLFPIGSDAYTKCVGYHAFNTYALGLLESALPNHDFWKTSTFESMVSYLRSERFEVEIDAESVYGYSYNPPGFEVPYSLYKLINLIGDPLVATTKYWMQKQLNRTWNSKRSAFFSTVPDPVTMSARVYELTRLPAEVLSRVEI